MLVPDHRLRDGVEICPHPLLVHWVHDRGRRDPSVATMKPLRVALLLFFLILGACASGQGLGRIPAPANPAPDASNAGPNLLIRLDEGQKGFGVGRHSADYLSDGTVIRWTDAGEMCERGRPCGTLERNTLTSTGLAALRARLAKDADLVAEPREIHAKSVSGYNTFVLERPDGSRYTVSAPDINSPYFNSSGGNWVPDAATERLSALAEAMVDPKTLVGANGLSNPAWEAYQPAKTAIVIRFSEGEPYWEGSFSGPTIVDITETGWPFEGTPDTFGGVFTFDTTDFPGDAYRCIFLPSTDAMRALASLPRSIGGEDAAGYLASGAFWRSGGLRWSAKSPTTRLSLMAVALLPEDAAASCANALSY